MDTENIVLCGANSYEKKFYLNEDFKGLPDQVKKELQIMCVMFTEDVGGIIIMEYDKDSNLIIEVQADEGDLLFDEIGADLKVKKLRKEKKDLFEALEMYYTVWREQNAFSN